MTKENWKKGTRVHPGKRVLDVAENQAGGQEVAVAFDRLAFVRSICSGFEDEPARRFLLAPFRVQGWTVATCGKALIAVPAEEGDPTPYVGDAQVQAVIKILREIPPLAGTATISDLKLWAGPHVEPCSACRGSPEMECECPTCGDVHECVACGGTSAPSPFVVYGTEEDRTGTIGGTPLNRRLVAWALRAAADERVDVHSSRNSREPLWLIGNPWRMAIMPLSATEDRERKNPFLLITPSESNHVL